ncbi:MAG: SagB/ThcOx family dehydrogenase [Ignavibacteriae bacterium]|nr:SagB/ThcOx family dehydrogenase [Ignavibacteriota bacterium]
MRGTRKIRFLAKTQLPKPQLKSNVSIEEALQQRRSVREYTDESLALHEVSQLLWAAYGITQHAVNGPEFLRGGFRTAPSAGALYPLEFYIVVGGVEGLEPGIYKYNSENHELIKLIEGDKRKDISNASLSQEMFESAPLTIVITAVFSRTTGKYGTRGREHYVWCTCTVGAFSDSDIYKLMKLSSEEEPIYLLPVGKKR